MKIINTAICNISNINFTSLKNKKTFPKNIRTHFDLNMETLVGYQGEIKRKRTPKNINRELARYFESLMVDWNKHVKQKTIK